MFVAKSHCGNSSTLLCTSNDAVVQVLLCSTIRFSVASNLARFPLISCCRVMLFVSYVPIIHDLRDTSTNSVHFLDRHITSNSDPVLICTMKWINPMMDPRGE